jgi:hypothetical protein
MLGTEYQFFGSYQMSTPFYKNDRIKPQDFILKIRRKNAKPKKQPRKISNAWLAGASARARLRLEFALTIKGIFRILYQAVYLIAGLN